MQPMDKHAAQAVAVSGLSRLAADDELLMRFSALTGILPNDMRQAAARSDFLVGVLDFYLAYEPDLLAWADADNMPPQNVLSARHTLAPEDRSGFE